MNLFTIHISDFTVFLYSHGRFFFLFATWNTISALSNIRYAVASLQVEFKFTLFFNFRKTNGPTQSSNRSTTYVNDSGDNMRMGSSNVNTLDRRDTNCNINTKASADVYTYVDSTPLTNTNMMDNPSGNNTEIQQESEGDPGDWPIYFKLEKKTMVMGVK